MRAAWYLLCSAFGISLTCASRAWSYGTALTSCWSAQPRLASHPRLADCLDALLEEDSAVTLRALLESRAAQQLQQQQAAAGSRGGAGTASQPPTAGGTGGGPGPHPTAGQQQQQQQLHLSHLAPLQHSPSGGGHHPHGPAHGHAHAGPHMSRTDTAGSHASQAPGKLSEGPVSYQYVRATHNHNCAPVTVTITLVALLACPVLP